MGNGGRDVAPVVTQSVPGSIKDSAEYSGVGKVIQQDDGQQDHRAIASKLPIFLSSPRREKTLQNMAAVQGWYGEEVKEPETDVQEQEPEQEMLVNINGQQKGSD